MLGFNATGAKPTAGESLRVFVQPAGLATHLAFGTIAHVARAVRPAGVISTTGFGTIAKVAPAVVLTGLVSRLTYHRLSSAVYFDSTHTMQLAGVDVPRTADYGVQVTGLNSIRNSVIAGGAPGTPGTPPTNWSMSGGVAGITITTAAVTSESGLPCIDITFAGTAGSTGAMNIFPETSTGIAAATAQAWSFSCYLRLMAGSLTGLVPTVNISSLGGTETTGATITPTGAGLLTQRFKTTGTTTTGTTNVQPRIRIGVTSGAVVSFTLRVGAPQIERGSVASVFTPTTGTAITTAPAPTALYEAAGKNLFTTGNAPFPSPWVTNATLNSQGSSTDIAALYAPALVTKHARNTTTVDTNVGSRSVAGLTIGQSIVGSFYVWVPNNPTITTLVITLGAGVSSAIDMNVDLNKRDQWQRAWCSGVLTGTSINIIPRLTANTGDVIYTTCWQLEAVAAGVTTPSSYIPTAGATASRASDLLAQWGVPTINQQVHPTGKASTLAFGTMHPANIARMAGIGSTLAFGTIAGSNRPHPVGKASTLAFGVPKFKQNVHATGRATTVAFGVKRISQRVHPVGFSHAAFGAPVILLGKSILQYFATATPSFSRQNAARRVSVPYGDGYNQVAPNGLTPIDRTLTLSWSEIQQDDVSRIVAVLRAHIGLTFSFVAPGEIVPRKWLPTKWTRTHPYPGADGFSITFEERPYINLVS